MRKRTRVVAVMLTGAFGVLTGCAAPSVGDPMYRVEVQTRQLLYPSGLAGSATVGPSAEGSLRMGAQQLYWIVPGKSREVSRSVLRETEAPTDGRSQRTVSRRVVDFQRGLAWRSEGGGPFRRTTLHAEEYDQAIQERINRMELVDQYLRSPALRELADIAYFEGRKNLVLKIKAEGVGRRQVVWVAAQPGVLWEITLRGDLEFDAHPWLKEAFLHALIGLPREVNRELSSALEGFPVRLREFVLPRDEGRTVIDHEVLTVRKLSREESFFTVPETAKERPREPRMILQELERTDRQPEDPGMLELLLELEPQVDEGVLGVVAEAWSRTPLPFLKVELMRIALRRQGDVAAELLRSSLRGARGADALAAVEALLAERHPRAKAALLETLRARTRFDDVPAASVVVWGVLRLRVLSDMSLHELASALAEIWPGKRQISGAAALHEAFSQELDFWLRREEALETGDA